MVKAGSVAAREYEQAYADKHGGVMNFWTAKRVAAYAREEKLRVLREAANAYALDAIHAGERPLYASEWLRAYANKIEAEEQP